MQGHGGTLVTTTRHRLVRKPSPLSVFGGAATGLYIAFITLPVLAMLIQASRQDSFLSSVTSDFALTALKLSLITSLISLVLIVVAGTPFAYILARSKSPILRLLDTLIELPILLPPVVAGVAMLMTFGRRGILGSALEDLGITIPFTTTAVVFAQIFVASPFYIRAARLGFQTVARDYEDVSLTLGVSPWATFWRLTLPLAGPSLLAGLALSWARALSEFGATIMFAGNLTGRTQTMPLAIMTALEGNLDAALALSILLLVGAVLLLSGLALVHGHQLQRRV